MAQKISLVPLKILLDFRGIWEVSNLAVARSACVVAAVHRRKLMTFFNHIFLDGHCHIVQC